MCKWIFLIYFLGGSIEKQAEGLNLDQPDEGSGIIARSIFHIFKSLQNQTEWGVKVSFLELYNEELIDLLSNGRK